jgi:hypothetical protein
MRTSSIIYKNYQYIEIKEGIGKLGQWPETVAEKVRIG